VKIAAVIKNTDRTAGAMLSGEVAKIFGHAGLPDDTIHVGASQYHDIRAAAALGYRTVFVDRHGEKLDTAPTRVTSDLATLPDVIDALE